MTTIPSDLELTALLQDITKKQELADALQTSFTNHQETIKSLGLEMLQLKKVQARYKHENQERRDAIAAHNTKSVLSTQQLLEADHEVVAIAHATLSQRLAFVLEENRTLMARIQKLQNQVIEQNEKTIQIEALHQAHRVQSVVLAGLRDEVQTAATEKRDLVRNQRVIMALEQMTDEMALRGADAVSEVPVTSPAFALLQDENTALVKSIDGCRRRVQAAKQLEEIGDDIPALKRYLVEVQARHDDLAARNFVLKSRAGAAGSGGPLRRRDELTRTDAETAAQARQDELIALSKEHATKELALEMKILEARSIATHGFSSATAFVLNESTPQHRRVPSSSGVSTQPWPGAAARRGTPSTRLEPLHLSDF